MAMVIINVLHKSFFGKYFTYFDEAIMEEEANGGGTSSRVVAVSGCCNRGNNLINLGAGVRVEIQ
jgi:hypothetical protein